MSKKIYMATAPWCGVCNAIKPTVTKLKEEFKDKIELEFVDVDTASEFTVKHSVTSIPLILFTNNDNEMERHLGAITYSKLKSKIESFLEV